MMSTHAVEVCLIDDVQPHPNADRLELVQVKGWRCVTQKGAFKPGDTCIYIPIDSVLPSKIEEKLFGADAKVKLSKSRVKTIKLRGAISQGMAVPVTEFVEWVPSSIRVGSDVAAKLGITKYEPPRKPSTRSGVQVARKYVQNPHFRKYTDLENYKNYPNVFEEGETVVITEKIHGTNFRAGWVPHVPTTLWQRIKKWLGFAPTWEFVYGSRNLQLQLKRNAHKTYYKDNVYWEAVEKYQLQEKLDKGCVVYGEIYGPDIQKGYHYGCKPGERKLVLFDVYTTVDGPKFLDAIESRDYLNHLGLPVVPLIQWAPFSARLLVDLAKGPSILAPSQSVKEGVVVRPVRESTSYCGRKVLKVINDDYLLSKYADEEVAHDQVG
jgi:RNA ligase (TIGR02306 family)